MIFDSISREQRKRKKLVRDYDKLLEKARKEKRHGDHESLAHEARFEIGLVDDEIRLLQTSRLRIEAESLGVPIPRYDAFEPGADEGNWERGTDPSTVYLSLSGQAVLRKQIRLEKQERRQSAAFWVKDILAPILSLIIGLLGAAMGFISLTHSAKK